MYKIESKNGKKTKTLIRENITESSFEYIFVPKDQNDKSFSLDAIFDLDSIKIIVPARVDMSLGE